MADEFQSGISGGNWWNSSRSGFNGVSSACSTTLSDMGSFGWAPQEMPRSCEESASVSGSSMVFQDAQKPQGSDSVGGGGGGSSGSVLMDSTLQMMGFGLSSQMDWNQALLRGSSGTSAESNFHSMMQENCSIRPNLQQETGVESPQLQKEWSPKNFSGGVEDSSINAAINFPMNSSASYGCPSTLIQSLFEPDDPQPQQSSFENRSISNPSPPNYNINSNEFSPSWSTKYSQFLRTSPPPKQQQPSSQLHFSNNTPFWNASAAAMTDVRSSFVPLPQSQFITPSFDEKPICNSNLTAKSNREGVRDSSSVGKKGSSEPLFKRPRIETPSPLPTFKVRKEKLGDRITALQQLVAPFGKTDTASVLYEAIEYIKFLHEQVSVLSTPYMKNGAPIQHHQQNSDKSKDPEGPKLDLRSRGLCLVPISSTFPVTANEMTADFWTPTFGGTFR